MHSVKLMAHYQKGKQKQPWQNHWHWRRASGQIRKPSISAFSVALHNPPLTSKKCQMDTFVKTCSLPERFFFLLFLKKKNNLRLKTKTSSNIFISSSLFNEVSIPPEWLGGYSLRLRRGVLIVFLCDIWRSDCAAAYFDAACSWQDYWSW